MAKKSKACKRMEKKAREQHEILERLLPEDRQPSTISWRRAFRPHNRLEPMSLTQTSTSTTPPDEL